MAPALAGAQAPLPEPAPAVPAPSVPQSPVLPSPDADGEAAMGEVLRAAVEARHIPNERASRGFVTISVGAATALNDREMEAKELLQRADAALYRSKQGGRNRVSIDSGMDAARQMG